MMYLNNPTLTQTGKSLEEMLNDCSIDAIMAIDNYKNLIAWNTTAEKIHGRRKYEVIGKSVLEIIPSIEEDEETLKAISLALKGVKSFVPASKKYYHRKHAENHFIPLRDESNITGVMNLVHDVSHRVKAEEQLQDLNDELSKKNKELQQRNKELIALSNVASHDLKEPLRKIYTAVEAIIVHEARQLSNSGKAHLRRIQSASQKMVLITDDLLSFTELTSEKNSKNFTLIELDDVLNEAIKRMHRYLKEKNAVFEAKKLPVIFGNYNMLAQLFQNIIKNVIKFQRNNNQPVIKIEAEKTEELNDGYLKISFIDNGIGFKQEYSEIIFNLFTRINQSEEFRGNGMGLAICKKIMDQHNGFIKTISEEGNGTQISCYFPVDSTID